MTESLATIRVPATTANLGPGFDSFGVALDLHLHARAVPRVQERIVARGEGAVEVSEADDNLLWSSLVAFCQQQGVPVPDVSVEVDNAIPLARGLGSSSAAIVAGIGLARRLSGVPVSDIAAVELATELEGHPDNVAPAVIGGFVACATGDDQKLVVRMAVPSRRLAPVVFVPGSQQLTSEARALVPEALPTPEVVDQAARAGLVVGVLAGLWPPIPNAAGDRLHEDVRLDAMPATGDLVRRLREAGFHAWLSGAGPAVAAVAPAVLAADAASFAPDGWAAHRLRWDLSGATTGLRTS